MSIGPYGDNRTLDEALLPAIPTLVSVAGDLVDVKPDR